MRKILFGVAIALAALLGPRWGFCADPVTIDPFPNSTYAVQHGTVTLSSTTVTTFAATNRFRELYIGDPTSSVSIFYRADGFSTFVSTVGWWVPAGTGQKIESNNAINLLLGAGAASFTARYAIFEK